MNGILPKIYLDHIMTYAEAIYALLGDRVIRAELTFIEDRLSTFVKDYEHMYGEEAMTYNVHISQHLCEAVRMCGPLWTVSHLPFERKNG